VRTKRETNNEALVFTKSKACHSTMNPDRKTRLWKGIAMDKKLQIPFAVDLTSEKGWTKHYSLMS
jgi:hypothetical protein